jgi:hypothetical protein
VSQRATETALGKLVCDEDFRREFYEDSDAAVVRSGLYLTEIELASLRNVSRSAIERLAAKLDDRIRRADHQTCD